MAERRVVFNADDLGVSAGPNAGIRAAAAAGLVKETSLCVTGVAAEEGARVARETGLGVGLHLSFTLGRALTGPVRGLTDAAGEFLPLREVLRNCFLRRVERDRVVEEISAQLARLRDLGHEPTHLNGHHHVHTFPVVRHVVPGVLQNEQIPYVRLPLESLRTGSWLSPRRTLLRRMARNLRRLLRRAGARARSLPFVGIDLLDRADYRDAFLRTARRLRAPDAEWMVHPRTPDADFARLDRHEGHAHGNADAELAALSDAGFVEAVRAHGIRPIRYSEL